MVIYHMYNNQHTLHSLVELNGGMHETKHANQFSKHTDFPKLTLSLISFLSLLILALSKYHWLV